MMPFLAKLQEVTECFFFSEPLVVTRRKTERVDYENLRRTASARECTLRHQESSQNHFCSADSV